MSSFFLRKFFSREGAPPSAVNNTINYTGLAAFFIALWCCRENAVYGVNAAIIVVTAYAATILFLEVIFLRTPWRDSVGLDFTRANLSLPRVAIKVIGLYGSFAFVALLYWLFPEYHGTFYNNYWKGLEAIAPFVLIASVPYIVYMDRHMREPEDIYYQFGKCMLLDFDGVNRIAIGQHLLSWVVKGFFLPLMFISFTGNIQVLSTMNIEQRLSGGFQGFMRLATDILFTIDLLAAVAGYTLAIRLFDTHFRSAEPTMFGWFVCLMCYQPFLSIYMRYYLVYSNNNWLNWLKDYPTLQIIWGSFALVLLTIYSLASINFGCRFSNLTHRGVLTNGMYRLTKHPAYVCKNTYWWMMHVPFVPTAGWVEAVRYMVLMLGINTVYFLRARTEERHMSHDPDYVRYALWMNERSAFAWLGRLVPFFRYKAPKDWEKLEEPYKGLK